jgi:hypothetical protein
MKRIGTMLLASMLGGAVAHARTPGTSPRQEVPNTQAPRSPSETTGAGNRSQTEIGPAGVVPPDGATDRAPPTKLHPGQLPTPQNPKAN